MTMRSLSMFLLGHVWFFMITRSIAQFVVDTNGKPVERNKEYFIRSAAISGIGGDSILVSRNGSCLLQAGLDNNYIANGLAVKFTPFAAHHDDDYLRLNRDVRITFQTSSSCCAQSTDWRLGEKDATSGRQLIIIGRDGGTVGSYGNFFRIVQIYTGGTLYYIQWCPTEVCPNCRFECGTVSTIWENGKILLALGGGSAHPIVLHKTNRGPW
ncbi:unnamed protein product [Vicia faba]|uniref:Uncharacterized protein n=1 Tax=Vicia faba TaxID=3906 RepID=A0AAV1ACW5_VICFA|nr:unnamed protein product [Vicia faba]